MKKIYSIVLLLAAATGQRILGKPTCPKGEATNCANCAYYYPKRLSDLFINSPLFDTQTLCTRCFSLPTARQRNSCYSCMTSKDKVLRNRNEPWCPIFAGNFKQSGTVLGLITDAPRLAPTPLSKAKRTDTCPQGYRRFCIDCKQNYPKIAASYGIKKPRYDGKMLCATCFALPIRAQQQWCYNCITDEGVMKAGNEPWCHTYSSVFGGDAGFLKLLRSQYYPPIPEDM